MSAFGAGSNTQCNQQNNCKIIAMVAVPTTDRWQFDILRIATLFVRINSR